MRRIALLAVSALVVASASSTATSGTVPRLVPNVVAFRDRLHGVLGTGYDAATAIHGGAIELTSDGGRTWRTVLLTPRPVVALTRVGAAYVARYDDGETLQSRDGGRWRPLPGSSAGIDTELSVCPQGMTVGTSSGAGTWSLCTTQPGAGSQGKAVYRYTGHGWRRVACTPFFDLAGCSRHGYGGISSYGYPLGIAGSDGGFGLIWESRGTLWITRDGGRHWRDVPRVVRPEIDFGTWAFVLPKGGIGWEVVAYGGTRNRRLLETTDAGRTWRVVHRWAAAGR